MVTPVSGMLGVVIDEKPWMTPPVPGLLTGEEVIAGASSTVRDFWSWALSNLRANTVRGTLAEYLVACAVGSGGHPRIEWDAYDVLTPGNRRIEVKSGAYLQAWEQPRHSKIIFRGLRAQTWTSRDGYSDGPSYNADVYVFAVLTATEHKVYDALDTRQWNFWVLSAAQVQQTNQASMGLAKVIKLAGAAVGYEDLAAAIEEALDGEPAPSVELSRKDL